MLKILLVKCFHLDGNEASNWKNHYAVNIFLALQGPQKIEDATADTEFGDKNTAVAAHSGIYTIKTTSPSEKLNI